ncbi:MAG: hypothetical protein LKH33_11610 [Acetobacter sp.]|nr:hypothetical protein [Acetobacter sp.]MCH4059960.1 hypothetical protein [Acetobacter sp.]MCH4086901.1 hypothetical protein [Acetobacter sp.]MCI1294957.1 hypothetical protein [Acetobacter sp.]MCI1320929.1 hypothetical protein [Acetobacter sp.]
MQFLARRGVLLIVLASGSLASCQMPGSDPRAGDNIDVPPERPGRNFPEAAEAEERRERNADYSDATAPKGGYEPAPNTGISAPKPGSGGAIPDTEVTYGRPDAPQQNQQH